MAELENDRDFGNTAAEERELSAEKPNSESEKTVAKKLKKYVSPTVERIDGMK